MQVLKNSKLVNAKGYVMKTQEELIKSNDVTLHSALEAVYLDWVNNFMSVQSFAEYYGVTYDHALILIKIGKLGNLREQGYY
jgi:hypothetical protein